MKAYADYVHYQPDDFLSDNAFRAWVRRPTPEATAYWRGLVRTHPHLRDPVEQARRLALGLESSWTHFSDAYLEQSFERIHRQLPQRGRVIEWGRWGRYGAVAAAVAMLITGVWAYAYFFTEQTIKTGYGELRTVKLHDGSVVTLNANSRLQLPSRYQWQSNREVWLDGEAYFAVSKQRQTAGHYRKFTVHTHAVDVAVLGTQFNVYARPQKTQVFLDEGRVELSELTTRRRVVMQPGQLVEYAGGVKLRQSQQPQQPTVAQAQQLTAWRQNLLVCTDVGMAELTRRFGEVYGLELVLTGDAFADQQFTGELPINDLDKALRILSETFDRKAVREGAQVYFVETN